MNYLFSQQALTLSIECFLAALFSLLALQWGIGLRQNQPPGQRFACSGWQPWWVKIRTTMPSCTYYFGPFPFRWMAQRHRAGYCEDLALEQAQGIDAVIVRDEPVELTFSEEFDPILPY